MTDKVNHPSHYNKGGMEVIEGLRMLTPQEYKGFMKANVIKYVARCEYKDNAVEDLEKAEFYLGKLKEAVKMENGETKDFIDTIEESKEQFRKTLEKIDSEMKKISSEVNREDKYTFNEASKIVGDLSQKQFKELINIVDETPYSSISYIQHFGLPDEVKALSDDAGMTMTDAGFTYKPTKTEMLIVHIPTMGFFNTTKTVEFSKRSMEDLVIENYWLEQKNDDLKEKVKKLESKHWWQR